MPRVASAIATARLNPQCCIDVACVYTRTQLISTTFCRCREYEYITTSTWSSAAEELFDVISMFLSLLVWEAIRMQAAWPLLLLLVLMGRGAWVSGRAVSSPHLLLHGDPETESEDTRRVLGSSVVTSVSVIMDLGNGNQAVYADATGRPVAKPEHASHLASPPHLMSPDRYEFYTFNDAGDLVKRLMTLDEIQSLIAGESVEIGSDLPGIEADEMNHPLDERPPAFFFLPRPVEQSQDWSPPAVDKVVANVQNILASLKDSAITVNDTEPTWSILPITTHNPQSGLIPTEKIPLLTQLYQISTTSATQKPDMDKIKLPVESTTEPIKHKPIILKDPTSTTKTPINNFEQLSTFIPIVSEKYPAVTQTTATKMPEFVKKPTTESTPPSITKEQLISSLLPESTTEKTTTKPQVISTETTAQGSLSTFIPMKIATTPKPSVTATQKISTPKPESSDKPTDPIIVASTESTVLTTSSSKLPLKPMDIIADNLQSIHQISNALLDQTVTITKQTSTEKVPMSTEKLSMTTEKMPPSTEKVPMSTEKLSVTSEKVQISTQKVPTTPEKIQTEKLQSSTEKIQTSTAQFTSTLDSSTSSTKNTGSIKPLQSISTVFDETPFSQSTPSKTEQVVSTVTNPTTDSKLPAMNDEMTPKPVTPVTSNYVQLSTSIDRFDTLHDSVNKIEENITPQLPLSTSYINKRPDVELNLVSDKDPSLSSSTLATFGISSVASALTSSSNNLDISSSLFSISPSDNIKPVFTTESYSDLANSAETTFVPILSLHNPHNLTSPSYTVTQPNTEYADGPDYPNLANFGDDSEEDATSKTSEIELTSEYSPVSTSNSATSDVNPTFNVNKPVTSHPNELLELLSEITGDGSSEEIERFETTVYPDSPVQTVVPFISQITKENSSKPIVLNQESSEEVLETSSESMERLTTIPDNQMTNKFTTDRIVTPTVATIVTSNKPLVSVMQDMSVSEEESTESKEKITTMIPRSPQKSTIAPDVDMNAIAGILDMITGTMPTMVNNAATTPSESKISTGVTPTTLRFDDKSETKSGDLQDNDSTESYEKITTLLPFKTSDSTLQDFLDEEMVKLTTFEPNMAPTTGFPEFDEPLADMVENVDMLESLNAMKHEHDSTNHAHVVKKPGVSINNDEKLELISTTEFSIVPTSLTHSSTVKIQTNVPKENNTSSGTSTLVPVTLKQTEAPTTPTVVTTNKVPSSSRPGTFITHAGIIPIRDVTKQPERDQTPTTSPLIQIMSTGTKLSNKVSVAMLNQAQNQNKVTETATKPSTFVKISTLATDEPMTIETTPSFEMVGSSSSNPLKQQRPVDAENAVDVNAPGGSENISENIPDLEVSWQEPQEVVWTILSSPATTEPPKIESTLLAKPEKKPVNQLSIVLNNSSKVEEMIVDKILESFMGNEIKTDIPRNTTVETKTTAMPQVSEYIPIEESTIRVATLTVPVKNTSPTPLQNYKDVTKISNVPTLELTNPPSVIDSTSFTKFVTDAESTSDDMELVSSSNTEYEKLSTIPVRYDGQYNHGSHIGVSVPSYPENLPAVKLDPAPVNNLGLEATTVSLDEDVRRFIDLNNDVAIRMFKHVSSELDKRRSIVLSPFGTTSLLAMVFLGARGQTSAQMNDFLPLDDMTTFNPHLIMMNITDSVIMSPDIKAAALVRQLYSQQNDKGRLLDFYKARAGAFYDGIVQEVEFNEVSDVVRLRTNELVRTQTSEKVPNFLSNTATLRLRSPLAALSTNVFQMDCHLASSQGRNSEIQFYGELRGRTHMLPSIVWTGQFLIGYDTGLDATAVEIPHSSSPGGALTSTVFVMPGRPEARGSTPLLARLEARLISRRAWSGLLRNLMRSKSVIDVQIPRFEHRSVLNMTAPLRRMGLRDLFTEGRADLRGVNGIQDLFLTDLMQVNAFSACSDPNAEGHVETYPTSRRTGRVGSRVSLTSDDDEDEPDWRKVAYRLPLALRPRQARIPVVTETARLRLDRPFLYIVRHNPTGMIIHMGRFNPKLMS
ncbi:hypothetical protein B566_EDAN010409 [Ephemera danica]|nr:hypothetical protein B566_EDAN010409 [Ephemera danica]